MTRTLDTPFQDVRGDTLRWALGLPPQQPLASREITVPGGRTVSLGVLGASHQVLVRGGGDGLLSETVACGLAAATPLPARARRDGYEFESGIRRLAPEAFADAVDELVARLDQDPAAIVAGFPGVTGAVTALALRPLGHALAWETWHSYPQTGELVHTSTRLDST